MYTCIATTRDRSVGVAGANTGCNTSRTPTPVNPQLTGQSRGTPTH